MWNFIIKGLRRQRDVLYYGDPKPVEIVLAIVSISWGLWVLNPFIFSLGSSSAQAYVLMLNIMPEYMWGIIPILMGSFRLHGIAVDSIHIRRLSSLISLVFWTFVSSAFIFGTLASTGTPVYICFALASLWLRFRQVERQPE